MNIHKKIAAVKKELSETNIAKTGINRHLNFKYHELADFLPYISKLNEKHGLNDVISINNDLATLTIHDTENDTCVAYAVPFVIADMQPKNDSIQKLGASLTYLRRYLYVQAYAITENDAVDAQPLKETPQTDNKQQIAKFFSHVMSRATDEAQAKQLAAEFLQDEHAKTSKTFDWTNTSLVKLTEQFDAWFDGVVQDKREVEGLL